MTIERAAHISVIVIAVVVVFAALDIVQNIFAPVVLAVVTAVILSPATNRLDAWGLPRVVTAFVSFLVGILGIVLLVLLFQPAVDRTIAGLPKLYSDLNSVIFDLQSELRGMKEVEESVKEMVDPEAAAKKKASGEDAAESAADAIPGVEDVVLLAPSIAAQLLIFLGTYFFFVLTKDEVYEFASRRFSNRKDRAEIANRLRLAEKQVARYFLTISIVNFLLGCAVTAAMTALGMPSPILWGIGAFVLNYLIYLGPVCFAAALIAGGIAVFDGPMAAAPAAIYLTLNMMEAQFVTPAFLGKSLSVNPLLIFLTVAFFLWLWGPLGAVVAIPILLWIIALAGLSKLVGEDVEERAEA